MIIVPTEKRFDWAHAPLVLFAIVVINVVVFFTYQSGDEKKYELAFEHYLKQGYDQVEWPFFLKYLELKRSQAQGNSERLNSLYNDTQALHDDNNRLQLSYILLRDTHFHQYLLQHYTSAAFVQTLYDYSNDNGDHVFSDDDMRGSEDSHTSDYSHDDSASFYKQERQRIHLRLSNDWREQREYARAMLNTVSAIKLGLVPSEISLLTLISSQFLHGDTMHLIGNLFFLVVCGFAVEAAIGHLRFLFFYLISGLGGGLLHALLNIESNVPLVGASGAISGVMAMYLAIFRLRKIEFFYWFLIFVGYFRAPALFILPFYIGTELYSYISDEHSTTAFMAHTGGFIVGGVLIGLNYAFFPSKINREYIEEDQDTSDSQLSLAAIYAAIEKYQFSLASSLSETHRTLYGENLELDLIRFNLSVNIDSKRAARIAMKILTQEKIERRYLTKINTILHDYPVLLQHLNFSQLCDLGINFSHELASTEQLAMADKLFELLVALPASNTEGVDDSSDSLSILARRLASVYSAMGNAKKSSYYSHYFQNTQRI